MSDPGDARCFALLDAYRKAHPIEDLVPTVGPSNAAQKPSTDPQETVSPARRGLKP